jgi:hypothetical protein
MFLPFPQTQYLVTIECSSMLAAETIRPDLKKPRSLHSRLLTMTAHYGVHSPYASPPARPTVSDWLLSSNIASVTEPRRHHTVTVLLLLLSNSNSY